jgi:mRNA interferase RelE/StbE
MNPTHYRLLLLKSAEKELDRLMRSDRERVEAAIAALADDPRPKGCKKIVAREGYRVRVGVYRITYIVDDDALMVTVYSVSHRKDAYR